MTMYEQFNKCFDEIKDEVQFEGVLEMVLNVENYAGIDMIDECLAGLLISFTEKGLKFNEFCECLRVLENESLIERFMDTVRSYDKVLYNVVAKIVADL